MRTKAIRYAQKSIKYNDLAIAYDKTITRVISKALNPDYGIDFADDYPIGEA